MHFHVTSRPGVLIFVSISRIEFDIEAARVRAKLPIVRRCARNVE